MELITHLLVLIVGFIAGALVTRNNVKRVNEVVAEAKEIAEKVDKKIDTLQAQSTTRRKPTKTQQK